MQGGFVKPAGQALVQDELLDIVDEQDQVIGSMLRSDVYRQKLYTQMRSIWLMIKNSQGQLLILRRSYDRPHLPGYLDGAVAGHVQAGETYEQALFREASEELNIDMDKIPYRVLGKLTPLQDKVFCFAQVYEAELEDIPENWNREEFCECFWAAPQEILEKIKDGDKHKDSLPIVLRAFYTH